MTEMSYSVISNDRFHYRKENSFPTMCVHIKWIKYIIVSIVSIFTGIFKGT